jgi:hypothetical protein
MAETPPFSLINFQYSIEVSGGVLFIKDSRDIAIVNQYHKIKPELNIDDELKRIVFFAPLIPTTLDFKLLKQGRLRFENFQNNDVFEIKFIDTQGNNTLNEVITSFMGSEVFTLETIAEYFFR